MRERERPAAVCRPHQPTLGALQVTAARAAAANVDAQRQAAVASVQKALARLRDREMAWSDERDALLEQVAALRQGPE